MGEDQQRASSSYATLADQWRVQPGTDAELQRRDSGDTGTFQKRAEAEAAMDADLERLLELQEQLYVDGRTAVLLVLQGMDTSGKDGTVRHLSRGLDLLGAELTSFKAPTESELRRDFLWRVHQRVPERGRIGIFNRSHYEDVLIARVKELVPAAVWQRRYAQINAFEELLTETGTIIVKCFLHISKDEQKERLQARLDDPAKHWKFDPGDLRERALWDAYTEAYTAAIERCNSTSAPWFVIPADHKWYRNFAITRVLVETLEKLDLRAPTSEIDPSTITIE